MRKNVLACRTSALIATGAAIATAFVAGFYANEHGYAQRIKTPRIAPVPRSEWTEEQRQAVGSRATGDTVANIYTTMANHPDLARDWLTFAGHVLRRSSLPARDREILILRIGWLCKSEYEWAQHVRLGRTAGLNDSDIQNIMKGPTAAGLSEHDRLLMQACDELHKDAFVSDTTWNSLAKTYNTKQMMDAVFTVGEYNLVSMALNSFGVQLDPGLTGFPR